MKKYNPNIHGPEVETDKVFNQIFKTLIGVIIICIGLVILSCFFADEIDMIANKYPIIPIVIFGAPLLVWGLKRTFNRIIR